MTQTDPRLVANVPRLHQHMDDHRLAAVVARSGQNFTYLAGFGYSGTLARLMDLTDSPRGVMLLWPRRGDPVIIGNTATAMVTRRDCWISRHETYDSYVESPYARLCQVLREYGLDRERIGIEKDYVSALHWEEIQRTLPGVQLVDCSAMMDRVRWVKTEAEIALLERGADLLDDAYLEVFPTIRPGQREREVHSRLVHACLQRGAAFAHGMLNSSRNDGPFMGERENVLYQGDIVRNDYVAYLWEGYPGHQSRVVVIGQPSAEQRKTYTIIRDIYRRTIDRCRPGVLTSQLFAFVVEEFARHGWEYKIVPLVGHSVGAWWHQQEPILTRGRDVPLEEGMVLAIEPVRGYWHLQDMIVVRKDGPQLISDKFPTDEMFVAG
jgi:Xaa-Pro aminopeptidase